jgi:hypothetical protein
MFDRDGRAPDDFAGGDVHVDPATGQLVVSTPTWAQALIRLQPKESVPPQQSKNVNVIEVFENPVEAAKNAVKTVVKTVVHEGLQTTGSELHEMNNDAKGASGPTPKPDFVIIRTNTGNPLVDKMSDELSSKIGLNAVNEGMQWGSEVGIVVGETLELGVRQKEPVHNLQIKNRYGYQTLQAADQ